MPILSLKTILDSYLSKGHHTDELREIIMVQKKSRRKATVKRVARVRRPAPKKPYTPSPRTDGEVHANRALGYARVSTLNQKESGHAARCAATVSGCAKLFIKQIWAISDRPALKDRLEFARAGDTVLWRVRPPCPVRCQRLRQTVDTLQIVVGPSQPDGGTGHDDPTGDDLYFTCLLRSRNSSAV